MTLKRAWIRLTCVVDLPDDENDADTAFDGVCDAVVSALDAAAVPGVSLGSWGMDDADTSDE